jgi:hypothetical protein
VILLKILKDKSKHQKLQSTVRFPEPKAGAAHHYLCSCWLVPLTTRKRLDGANAYIQLGVTASVSRGSNSPKTTSAPAETISFPPHADAQFEQLVAFFVYAAAFAPRAL